MEGKQQIYYSFGELAWAVAKADGKVQQEEKDKFLSLMKTESESQDLDFDISEIIFLIMERDSLSIDYIYQDAIANMKSHSYFFSDDMKVKFVSILNKIAEAFGGASVEEQDIINRFEKDIADI